MKLRKIRDKILNLLCQNKEKKEILKDIKKAKQIFLTGKVRFMCYCFLEANPQKYCSVEDIRKIIPEFKPTIFPTTFIKNVNPDDYSRAWWPIADRESRIKAFDKLIEIYRK